MAKAKKSRHPESPADHGGRADHGRLEAAAEGILKGMDALGLLRIYDEGVIVTDATGRIVFYNASQAEIDDLPVDYVLGRYVTEIYNLDRKSSVIMRCLDRGEPMLNVKALIAY